MRLFWRNALLIITLLGLYGACYSALLSYRESFSLSRQHAAAAWTLPPLVLKVIAGEFRGLIADLIVLEAGSQLGTEMKRNPSGGYTVVKKQYDWDTISRLFFNSQALDPAFQHTYMLAQGWLPWEGNRIDEVQEILKTAADNRSWDWRPYHLTGFNNYYFLNQPGEAGKFFLEAAKTPHAPPFLAILGARLAQKGGETETAIALMKSMLASREQNMQGYDDIIDRLKALEGVLILEQAVARYRELTGTIPENLEELISSGVLTELPDNPYNLPYCIDAAGKVYFDNLDCKSASAK